MEIFGTGQTKHTLSKRKVTHLNNLELQEIGFMIQVQKSLWEAKQHFLCKGFLHSERSRQRTNILETQKTKTTDRGNKDICTQTSENVIHQFLDFNFEHWNIAQGRKGHKNGEKQQTSWVKTTCGTKLQEFGLFFWKTETGNSFGRKKETQNNQKEEFTHLIGKSLKTGHKMTGKNGSLFEINNNNNLNERAGTMSEKHKQQKLNGSWKTDHLRTRRIGNLENTKDACSLLLEKNFHCTEMANNRHKAKGNLRDNKVESLEQHQRRHQLIQIFAFFVRSVVGRWIPRQEIKKVFGLSHSKSKRNSLSLNGHCKMTLSLFQIVLQTYGRANTQFKHDIAKGWYPVRGGNHIFFPQHTHGRSIETEREGTKTLKEAFFWRKKERRELEKVFFTKKQVKKKERFETKNKRMKGPLFGKLLTLKFYFTGGQTGLKQKSLNSKWKKHGVLKLKTNKKGKNTECWN